MTKYEEQIQGMAKKNRGSVGFQEALAKPKQEPVAWVCYGKHEHHDIDFFEEDVDPLSVGTKLYTTPPQRKPLTDEEIETIWRRVQANDFHDCVQPFARAIEAAHGIGDKT